ncbi:MAG: alpha/beta fold hydrolase [Solirubrobacterales bacterium]|nr:alpha/beta fold hydrolase [Solirubrobacterales bacterium]MBV9915317.1 alpha/beta fold hydrolase [Solirubrobacterales bacterium]
MTGITDTAVSRSDVAVAGGSLAVFELSDSAPAREAPAVLAVHGVTATSRAWRAVARALADRARLIAPDLRGRGASRTLPEPYGIRVHVADLTAVLDHFDLERTVLVGHSLGADLVARVAVDHPERVAAVVLIDGGLTIPGSENVDPQEFADALLGPALARLRMTFPSREAYHAWWRAHPALIGGQVDDQDLVVYADHDLVGEAPELHPTALEAAVRADAGELPERANAAGQLQVPATLLCAPRGLQNGPDPMQPLALAQAWAAEDPQRRQARLVEDVNHYTITLSARGATAVAGAIVEALAATGVQSRS